MIRLWQCCSMAVHAARGLSHTALASKEAVHIPSFGHFSRMLSTNYSKMAAAQHPWDCYSRLPNLPVPKLEQTLEKYLWTVKPLLSEADFAITSEVAKNFGAPGGVGQKLQKMLEEKGSKEANWLSQWWLDAAYLTYRLPVVVHSNPGLVCPKQNFQSKKDQLMYAAKLIVGALCYRNDVYQAKLEQDYMGKSPLDMSQYRKMFSTCRIPGLTKDSLYQNADSRHIVVAHNNHFFKLEVYADNGEIIGEADLIRGLEQIVQTSEPCGEPVGFFTTENRNVWASAYQELQRDPTNQASFQAIHDSILLLCLDKESRFEGNMTSYSKMGAQVLHGGGPNNNSGNRWFDKTLQIIVGSDGVVGINYEHSPLEGPPIASLADYILSYAEQQNVTDNSGRLSLNPERLKFNLNSDLYAAVELAKRNIDTLAQDVDLNVFTFDKFGKEDVKALKMSPDSFIQIAIQMSFMKLHHQPTAHYESASTRKFTDGRTETIRTCLPDVVDFIKLHLKSPNEKSLTKYNALQSAMKAHKDYVQLAVNGQGIDRHLLGLKMLAIENGMDIPVFYLDPAYSKSTHWRNSTSQVAAKSDVVLTYGAVIPDGYGCCYNPRRDTINFMVNAFKSNPETCAKEFAGALQASLVEIRDIAASRLPSNL